MNDCFAKRTGCLISIFLFACISKMNAQHSIPDTIAASHFFWQINFDGNPNEAAWNTVQHISNFTQRELNFGAPASERTETAILYDANNLYIGVRHLMIKEMAIFLL
jgi:hypothetical protein